MDRLRDIQKFFQGDFASSFSVRRSLKKITSAIPATASATIPHHTDAFPLPWWTREACSRCREDVAPLSFAPEAGAIPWPAGPTPPVAWTCCALEFVSVDEAPRSSPSSELSGAEEFGLGAWEGATVSSAGAGPEGTAGAGAGGGFEGVPGASEGLVGPGAGCVGAGSAVSGGDGEQINRKHVSCGAGPAALATGIPAERTSIAPSVPAAARRRSPPWKPVIV